MYLCKDMYMCVNNCIYIHTHAPFDNENRLGMHGERKSKPSPYQQPEQHHQVTGPKPLPLAVQVSVSFQELGFHLVS